MTTLHDASLARHVTPDWPEADVRRLVELWDEGISAGKIAKEMGRSKNSIVGKAHRMDLAARQSPIRPLPPGQVRARRMSRAKAVTLAPVDAYTAEARRIAAEKRGAGHKSAASVVAAQAETARIVAERAEVVAPVRVAPAQPRPSVTPRTCCWPMWGNKERPPRRAPFCGAARDGERVYCAEHAAIAYSRPMRQATTDHARVAVPFQFRSDVRG